jgi:hypothetical protein
VGQPYLTAAGEQARRALGSGALSSYRTSTWITFEQGTKADKLVLDKGVHDDLLPSAEPGWRRSGI